MLVFDAVLLAILLTAAGTWTVRRYIHPLALAGTVLTPPIRAYEFNLPDQDEHLVSLVNFRGKTVALTFIYTHCLDVCPLIADNLHAAYERLGDLARRVAFVAVSVDPTGDTPAAIRAFLEVHHVEHELTYLHGTFAQLRPVWAHYYVGSDAIMVNPKAVAASTPTPQQVGHTAIVYVIDPRGEIRAFLPGNFDPQDLVTDLGLLAPRR